MPPPTRSGASSSIRSHSCSATRRPIAASSCDRTAPVRCAAAWPMQPMPHCRVFATSHQCSASRSTGAAARAFVRGDELVDRAEPADLERRAEAPRLDAQPREVLERVADVHELPVDRGREPVLVDDHVARAAGRRARSSSRSRAGRLATQPLVALLERRARRRRVARRPPRTARRESSVGRARHLGGIDGVQPGEEPAEVVDEVRGARRRTRRRAGSCAPASRRRRAPSPARRCRARAPSSSTSTSGTARPARRQRAHRVGFEPHRARQPGTPGRVAPQDQLAVRSR